ncbi:MAG: type II toxin-antitoxin system RelE/ParE family toxin [Flavobacteriales bacterium]|jgi:hypothetical protein|nr:type II toxin-antitoxin system RelE/ParE family toxin [Flavobacteriales bacterium]
MIYVLDIKEDANIEIVEAFIYYDERRTGLGDEFLEHFDIYFERITANPKHLPQNRKPYREAFLKRFPYLVIYEVIKNKVVIYSVFNTWQNPEKKKQ